MNRIIVTVADELGRFSYDLELPDEIPAKKLKKDIAEVLRALDNNVLLDPEELYVVCVRTGTLLQDNETLLQAGVWNGDILMVMER